MLTHLTVRNYRSLEQVESPLGPLVAFVGPNGSGKTTLLHAIDLVLGDAWPTLRSFRIPQDFTDLDATRELEIKLRFDPPYEHRDGLGRPHEVNGLRLTCRPYKKSGRWGEAGDLHVDLEPLNSRDEVPLVAVGKPTTGRKSEFSPMRVGTELRDHARTLLIDHRRSLSQHLPSSRGSILARLLEPARKGFTVTDQFKNAYEQAMDLIRTAQVREIEAIVASTAKQMLGFLGRGIAGALEIGFGFADPANPFGSLRLQYKERDLPLAGEELGLGVQSAIVVGIFEAFRQRGGDFGTLLIEEPEMYLHPQAQRYFFRILTDLVDRGKCQVIYSTHSPVFADVNRFESLRLVRRAAGGRTTVSYVSESASAELGGARERLKLGRFDTTRNEILFASEAVLLEGYADRLAVLTLAEKLGIDLDAEGIAVVDCGGKSGIELFIGVCKALEIPFWVVHDEDIWPETEAPPVRQPSSRSQENAAARRLNERLQHAVGDQSKLCVLRPSLEAVLGIGRTASDKPQRVAEALAAIDVTDPPEGLQSLVDLIRRIAVARESN